MHTDSEKRNIRDAAVRGDFGAVKADVEALRREIQTLAMVAGDRTVPVTASIGVASAASAEMDVTSLIERADEALYQAKRSGRNRFCVAGPAEPSSPAEPQALGLQGSADRRH